MLLHPDTSQRVPPAPNGLPGVVLCCRAIDAISPRGNKDNGQAQCGTGPEAAAPIPAMLALCRHKCLCLLSCPTAHSLKRFWPRSFS